MLIGPNEMDGAYELAKRIKASMKDIPRAEGSSFYRVQSIVVNFIIKLIDIKLEQMSLECDVNLTEQRKECEV